MGCHCYSFQKKENCLARGKPISEVKYLSLFFFFFGWVPLTGIASDINENEKFYGVAV